MNTHNKKELILKWIEALRSEKYTQGIGNLRSLNNKFCCLGVLCDIINPNGWVYSSESTNYSFDGKDGFLHSVKIPWPIRQEMNISLSYQQKLINMNDSGKSFTWIADYIEADLLNEIF